jgi:hypothetical protein
LPMQDLPKTVLDRLQTSNRAESHLDADLLTAFFEHSLVDSERARVLEHLAYCANCREIVNLALPAAEAATLPLSAAARNRWLLWPVLRWGVVAAGILAAASIGIMQYRQRENSTIASPILTARNDTAAAVPTSQPSSEPADRPAVVPPAQEKHDEAQKKTTLNGRNTVTLGQPVGSVSTVPKSYAMRSGASGTAGGRLRGDLAPGSETTGASVARAAPAQPVPQFLPPPSSQAVEVQAEEATTVATAQSPVSGQLIKNQNLPAQSGSATSSDVVKAKAPTSAEAAASAAPGQVGSYRKSMTGARWTISSSGALQKSLDAGNTWEDVDLNGVTVAEGSQGSLGKIEPKTQLRKAQKEAPQSNLIFRAVTAVGSEVWAGGSPAILLHSLDSGSHWTRVVPSSASKVLSGDITVINFFDALHGRVATSNGEVWITSDNGQTWSLQP